MYNFKNNISDIALFANYGVDIEIHDTLLHVNFPTFLESNTLKCVSVLFGMFLTDLEEFNKHTSATHRMTVETRIDALELLMTDPTNKKAVVEYMQRFIPSIVYNEHTKHLEFNGQRIPDELFQDIALLTRISAGYDNLTATQKPEKVKDTKDDDPFAAFNKRKEENDKKIRQAKEQKSESEGDKQSLEEIIITIMSELGIPLQDILNMNLFTIIWIRDYVPTIVNNKLQIASCNLQKNFGAFLKK